MPIHKTTAAPVRAPKPKQDAEQLFEAAVAQKRGGDVKQAVATLQKMLKIDPDNVHGRLALAGYQALAGDAAKARATFAAVAAPGPLPKGTDTNPDGFDYHMNAAWFHAVLGEDDGVVAHVKGAFTQVPALVARDVLGDFFATEPDLQRLQAHPAITALLAPPAASTTSRAPANAFEAAAAADFVKGQAAPAQKGGTSALATRVQNAMKKATTGAPGTTTKPARAPRASTVALQQLGGLVPTAAAVTKGAAIAGLATLLKDGIQEALDAGEESARFEPSQLNMHMAPAFRTPWKGYDDVVKALQRRGYEAAGDGFTGIQVSLDVAAPQGDTSAASKQAFLAELATKLPSPPTQSAADAADAGKRLAAFVTKEIMAAVKRGETSVVLETRPLDRAMTPDFPEPHKFYSAVAKQLKELGFETSSASYMGVGIEWQPKDVAPTKSAVLAAIAAEVPPATGSPTSAQVLGRLIQAKIDDAIGEGRGNAVLEPNELDRLLRPYFAAPYKGYEPLAKALEARGYLAGADGMTGVALRWGDD